jgi:hypothetical protein
MFFTGTVRRLFWVSMGATAGVLVFRQVTKTAKEFTPAGIADRVSVGGGGLTDSVKSFVEDVRDAMHDREEVLNVALGLDAPVEPADAVSKDAKSAVVKPGSNGAPTSARATEGRSEDE